LLPDRLFSVHKRGRVYKGSELSLIHFNREASYLYSDYTCYMIELYLLRDGERNGLGDIVTITYHR
jgi:hypothetical protein